MLSTSGYLLTHHKINDPHVVTIEKIDSIQKYSSFMIKRLANFFTTDFVMVVQADGFIVDMTKWEDEFLKYDYIGAPWPPYSWLDPKHLVGNGGFSIRSLRLQKILRDDPLIPSNHHEDTIICQTHREYLEKKYGITYAPLSVASRFSCEFGPSRGLHTFFGLKPTFGQHAFWQFTERGDVRVHNKLAQTHPSFVGYLNREACRYDFNRN